MNRKYVYFCFPVIVFIFLFLSSVTPVITRGEGREGLVVRALDWGESFVLPLRHGEEIPSKPPLFHWVAYGASQITGNVGPMEIRTGSAIGTALLIIGTYLFFSVHAGHILGLLTALVLASSLEVMRYSTQARVDPLFAGVFASAVYFIFSFYLGVGSRVLTGFGALAFLVLSVLAKGPFGLILPVGVLLLYLIAKRDRPDIKTLSKGFLIFLVALGLSSIWYFLAYKVGGDRFLEVQLLKENAYRVVKAQGDERGHEKPFYFTFIYLLLATIPWCLFLPRVVSGFKALRRAGDVGSDKLLVLSLSWLSLFIVAVMISVSKRSVYFLPALPAMSYLVSVCIVESRKLVLDKWIPKYEVFLNFILKSVMTVLIVAVLCILLVPFLNCNSSGSACLSKVFDLISVLESHVLLVYLVVLIFAFRHFTRAFFKLGNARVEDAVIELSLTFVLLFFSTQVLIASRIMAIESPENFMHRAVALLPPYGSKILAGGTDVFQYKNEYYAPAFYLDRPAPVLADLSGLNMCNTKICKDVYLFVSEEDLLEFVENPYELLLVSSEKLANRDTKLALIKISIRADSELN